VTETPELPVQHHGRRCHRPAGGLRGFTQPRILLLLLQEPGHGYALLERLSDEPGLMVADPGLLYRTLRQMESDGLVRSEWDTEGQGPARRLYEVTAEGIDALHAWAKRIERTREALRQFLDGYHTLFTERE
jgi:PadR family transcriptional regulator PadR